MVHEYFSNLGKCLGIASRNVAEDDIGLGTRLVAVDIYGGSAKCAKSNTIRYISI
ncbi:hypothetical protein V22_24020 [Calycomorphotria hydatis]|uniref:Uncharacterized protein n=1 Tax=Calycomorphotria hydatis TaxID=2528027 RepID=A0A517T9V1_9PLAN|nr:hypothetical protein V22_24020 [Calycomorphotria hydatis]